MLRWHGMWTALSSNNYHSLPHDLLPYQEYMKGCWVRRVYFDKMMKNHDGGEAQLERLIDFLFHQNCNAIEEVNFSVSNIKSITFSHLKSLCRNSLTRISISLPDDDSFNGSNATPYMILLHYPNLNQLYYAGPMQQQQPSSSIPVTNFKHQHLRNLTLNIFNIEGNIELRPILFAIPNLEQLRLNLQCIEHTIVSLLMSIFSDKFCPNVTTLILVGCCKNNIKLVDYGHEWRGKSTPCMKMINKTKQGNHFKNKYNGLRHLMLHDPSEKYHMTILQTLHYIIPQSHNTLETLHLSGSYKLHGNETMELLSQYIFPCLERLYLINGRYHNLMAYGNTRLFRIFAENSVPSLTTLKLMGLDSDYHIELPVLASSLNYVQEIHFEDCPEILPYTLVNFFNQLGENGRVIIDNPNGTNKERSLDHKEQKKHTMSRIILRNMPGVNYDTLITIFQKCCLEELVVQECDDLDMDDIGRLLDTLVENRGLKKLDLILIYHQPRFYFFARKVPVYPDPIMIQEILPKIDSRCIEWRLELKDYSQNDADPVCQIYDHMEYRGQKLLAH
ncbi:hypothetical protein BDA99DRAFT_564281 [Phascolomyces articulosus]|uniref:F-box domain-containing protein n=1 Tax=Phascolomyces articulosus TaxID=60185 RepID=A0AAD5K0U6_9FUNG|nr:hypothetical protein BDA99DRAFT_564281 [Phascolomyces articulosus]